MKWVGLAIFGMLLGGSSGAKVMGEDNANSPDCYCAVCPEHIKPECRALDKIGISSILENQGKSGPKLQKAI